MIANIIDRRERKYRWKCVDAVIEAVWHDNNCKDSDFADPEAERDILYDQRQNVSLNESVVWASDLQEEVTLYIYDAGKLHTNPDETTPHFQFVSRARHWRSKHQ